MSVEAAELAHDQDTGLTAEQEREAAAAARDELETEALAKPHLFGDYVEPDHIIALVTKYVNMPRGDFRGDAWQFELAAKRAEVEDQMRDLIHRGIIQYVESELDDRIQDVLARGDE